MRVPLEGLNKFATCRRSFGGNTGQVVTEIASRMTSAENGFP